MIFCIFSFNRGQFLENCIQSIEACVADPSICVFDDHSDDAFTRDILDDIRKRHQVVTPPAAEAGSKHGGLYDNMQSAIERFRDKPLVCFLQDDTQLVRPVHPSEWEEIGKMFDCTPCLGFVHPCFLRGMNRKRDSISMTFQENNSLYVRENKGQSAGLHYSDLFIAQPSRLLEKGWRFGNSEPKNDQQAKRLFGTMPYLFNPFMMWLPEVPAYRGKKKTLALNLAEKKKRCGFYPFRLLKAEEITRIRQRDASVLPFAEDFLSCISYTPAKPWTYNPLTGLFWLKKLNSLEVFLRKRLG